jgi:hypothetical protein
MNRGGHFFKRLIKMAWLGSRPKLEALLDVESNSFLAGV